MNILLKKVENMIKHFVNYYHTEIFNKSAILKNNRNSRHRLLHRVKVCSTQKI